MKFLDAWIYEKARALALSWEFRVGECSNCGGVVLAKVSPPMSSWWITAKCRRCHSESLGAKWIMPERRTNRRA